VLIKGGHATGGDAIDLLITPSGVKFFAAPRIATNNSHGTGCTLAAAIAAFLARGEHLEAAITHAKNYLTEAIRAGAEWKLGHGPGPVHHFHAFWRKEAAE
jgi:hydroxymethylpyrimidine kinase/phosphomethylpyrimidine kinase